MSPESRTGSPVNRLPLVDEEGTDVAAIVAVVRRLSIARSVQEIMETVTHPARTLLRAGGVTFVLRDGDLCYYAEEDSISPLWKGKRFPMDACISGWCMKERRGIAIRDIYDDPRIPHDVYRPTFVRSLAMVPVRQEDPIAAMGAYWPEVREPTKEELELLQTIANAASLGLMNVQLQSDSARTEEHRHELSHRIKNVFSVVQGLANQTRADTVDDYRAALTGRLRALETAHSALFRSETESTDLGTLLRDLLFPLVPEDGRFELSGPSLPLSGKAATDFAFVVHELGTNAVKHGALSVPDGRVVVEWRTEDGRLFLRWKERDGPPVRAPATSGFGATLIEGLIRRQPGGELKRDYDSDGLRCELSFTLP